MAGQPDNVIWPFGDLGEWVGECEVCVVGVGGGFAVVVVPPGCVCLGGCGGVGVGECADAVGAEFDDEVVS